MKIKLAGTQKEIEDAAVVMAELRTHYELDLLTSAIKDQMKHGYQLLYAEIDKKVAGVAGFVIEQKLAWGKNIYIDDLITSANMRSEGVGAALIDWLKDYAKENNCQQLHLDSGVQRFDAHRFYLNHGFNISSHHFELKFNSA